LKHGDRSSGKEHMKSDVVLFGTGSLARSVTYNVATTVALTPLRVLIVGRTSDDVEEVAAVAQGRAGATGQPHVFDTITANWADGSIAGDILHTHRPTVAVVTASEQSPWELADKANAWAQLVKRGGFGLTLPFNASLASQVFRAATATEPRPFFINACYPDAVNGLLTAFGPSDRLIGVGNAAISRASIDPRQATTRPFVWWLTTDTLGSYRRATSGIPRWWTPMVSVHRLRQWPALFARSEAGS
jgi:hypothetical protein